MDSVQPGGGCLVGLIAACSSPGSEWCGGVDPFAGVRLVLSC
jgi:hypothetical protein